MFVLLLLLAVFAVLATAAPATSSSQWFTIEWDAPQFSSLSGSFIVPELSANSGPVYIWPGLQGDDGALQAEVSGSSTGLKLRNVFYGASSTLTGTDSSRLAVTPGEEIQFSFFQIPGTRQWFTRLSDRAGVNTFTLPGQVLNRAIFAIELVNGSHDFDVQFNDVSIVASTESASNWCTSALFNGFTADAVSIQGAVAQDRKCIIDQIILPATA